MAIKILPSTEVRDKLAKVIEEVKRGGGPCFVTQYGRAVAVLLDIEQYNALIEIAEDYEDIVDMAEAKAEYVPGKGISLENYLRENRERLAALKDPLIDKILGS